MSVVKSKYFTQDKMSWKVDQLLDKYLSGEFHRRKIKPEDITWSGITSNEIHVGSIETGDKKCQ